MSEETIETKHGPVRVSKIPEICIEALNKQVYRAVFTFVILLLLVLIWYCFAQTTNHCKLDDRIISPIGEGFKHKKEIEGRYVSVYKFSETPIPITSIKVPGYPGKLSYGSMDIGSSVELDLGTDVRIKNIHIGADDSHLDKMKGVKVSIKNDDGQVVWNGPFLNPVPFNEIFV